MLLRSALVASLVLFAACHSTAEPKVAGSEPTVVPQAVKVAPAAATPGQAVARTPPNSPALLDSPTAPDGYLEMTVGTILPSGTSANLYLVDAARTRVLPIIIGMPEAQAIYFRMTDQTTPRPLTHDLLTTVIGRLGAQAYKVQVNKIVDQTYIGSVFLAKDGALQEIDARPSDAIALAIGEDIPIYVAQQVLDVYGEPMPEDADF